MSLDVIKIRKNIGPVNKGIDLGLLGKFIRYIKIKNITVYKKITLKKYCILGTNCVVTPNAEFGEGSVAGAQSLVNIKLKEWTIYQGFPLRGYFKRKKKFLKYLKKSLNDFV